MADRRLPITKPDTGNIGKTPTRAVGRPRGAVSKAGAEIRKVLRFAASIAGDKLKESGAVDDGGELGFLVYIAQTDPKAFLGAFGKCVPQAKEEDNSGAVTIQLITGIPDRDATVTIVDSAREQDDDDDEAED